MPEKLPAYLAPTFAERRKAREAEEKSAPAEVKQVDDESAEVEDKAVTAASTKKRTARKRS